VQCPRCRAPWGTPDSGLPPNEYNFFMQGLKTYTCALCLCDFGCMSAVHKCPHCKLEFDYDAEDYDRKITCGRAKCTALFGFYRFPVSDRRQRELLQELTERAEAARRAQAAKIRRNARNNARVQASSIGIADPEKAFRRGLLDVCPRCGWARDELDPTSNSQHLRACVDPDKHAAHAEATRRHAAKQAAKERKADAQSELENLRAWQAAGSCSSQTWRLTDGNLATQLSARGLLLSGDGTGEGSANGSESRLQRLALLSSCVRREGETLGRIAGSAPPLLLESSRSRSCTTTARPTRRLEATNLVQDEKKAIALRLEDLPSNPHALTTEELQACLVAWGFPMTRVPSSRPELLNLIENAREERKLDLPLLLTHVPNRSKEAESESEGAQESSGSEASPSRKRVRRGKAKQAEPRQQLKRRKTLADQGRHPG